jgi:hypothetical protein
MNYIDNMVKLQRRASLEDTLAYLEEIQTVFGVTTIEEAYEVLHEEMSKNVI